MPTTNRNRNRSQKRRKYHPPQWQCTKWPKKKRWVNNFALPLSDTPLITATGQITVSMRFQKDPIRPSDHNTSLTEDPSNTFSSAPVQNSHHKSASLSLSTSLRIQPSSGFYAKIQSKRKTSLTIVVFALLVSYSSVLRVTEALTLSSLQHSGTSEENDRKAASASFDRKIRQFQSLDQVLESATSTENTDDDKNSSMRSLVGSYDSNEILLAIGISTSGTIIVSENDSMVAGSNDSLGITERPTNTISAGTEAIQTRLCTYHRHDWLEAKLILMSIFGTIVATFGIFGNLTTALILTRPAMRSPNNLYLTALAVFDTCLLITAVLIYSVEYIVEFTNNFELYVAWLTYLRFCYAVSHISQTGSVYTTVAVTIERYLAVVHPHQSKVICTKRGASVSILGVTCFAILFNCTKFFELQISRKPGCTRFSAYSLTAGPLMESANYQIIYTLWLSNVVMVFLPFFTLLVFNSIIACFIRRSLRRLNWAKRGDKRSELKEKSRDATRVLIIIVLIFLICNFWGFVTTLLERIYGIPYLVATMPQFYAFSRESINFLAIINSSINFVIYCIFGKDFRKELIVVYGCRQVNGQSGLNSYRPPPSVQFWSCRCVCQNGVGFGDCFK